MAEHYNNGPEGMPRVKRMTDSTLDWVINGVDTDGMLMPSEDAYRKLRNVCHAAAEEALARIEWPERPTPVTIDAEWAAKSFSAAWDNLVATDPDAAQSLKQALAEFTRNPPPLKAGPG